MGVVGGIEFIGMLSIAGIMARDPQANEPEIIGLLRDSIGPGIQAMFTNPLTHPYSWSGFILLNLLLFGVLLAGLYWETEN